MVTTRFMRGLRTGSPTNSHGRTAKKSIREVLVCLSQLKTVNYRESLEIFQRDPRPVGTRDLIRRMSLADHSGAGLASTAHCATSASK